MSWGGLLAGILTGIALAAVVIWLSIELESSRLRLLRNDRFMTYPGARSPEEPHA